MKLLVVIFALAAARCASADENDDNTLKCLVQYLQHKGVNEPFFSSIGRPAEGVDCEFLINVRLTKAQGKIREKLNADTFFAKYSECIMKHIKTDENKTIMLQREAIKMNGLGVKVWNYFDQKEHLDDLKRMIEVSINKAATEHCVK